MLVDIRFQQLFAEKAQSAPTSVPVPVPIPSVATEDPQPTIPYQLPSPRPRVVSSSVLFVVVSVIYIFFLL
jgi:hypothetical protein